MVEIFRGDIVLVDLNPVTGSEQSGIRPCVILQTDRANKVSPITIIAPFTTRIRSKILPSHVIIPESESGLSKSSVLLCEQLRVIDKKRIVKVLGRLNSDQIHDIDKAIKAVLDLK